MPYNLKRDAYRTGHEWPYSYPPGYGRGIPLGYPGDYSYLYYGGSKIRMAISKGMNVEPVWYIMNFTLAARDSARLQFVPSGEFAMTQLTATSSQSGQSFQARLFQVNGPKIGFAMDRGAVNGGNRFGTAGAEFSLPHPHYPGERMPLMVNIANLKTEATTVQLSFFGMRPRPKTNT